MKTTITIKANCQTKKGNKEYDNIVEDIMLWLDDQLMAWQEQNIKGKAEYKITLKEV